MKNISRRRLFGREDERVQIVVDRGGEGDVVGFSVFSDVGSTPENEEI